ncbi:putative leucine-rich repeat domain superfamily [Helianthus annuus]|nr:putative leucine-rich repeat domain superfamily [Helianthus annuus]
MEIELHSCDVKFIKIIAPYLHLFLFHASKKDPNYCQIDVLECQKIMYLSLNNVVNGRDWIEEHFCSLRELKTFILNRCQDIEHFRVWNDKLERVVLCQCPELTSIEVNVTSLKSFMFERAHRGKVCNIKFLNSKYIRDLSIIKGGDLITDQWLEAQLVKMTRLERLRLKDCNSFRKIKVYHEKLQILELNSCHGLVEADIDTPQLVSFMYHGDMIDFGKMVTRTSCSAILSMN